MKFILEYWTWVVGFLGVGGAAALVCGFIFAPAATLSLLKNVVAFVVEKARDGAKWARDPERNWWKIGCFSFAGFFALASWYADEQRREVVHVTLQAEQDIQVCRGEAASAITQAQENYNALLACRTELAKVVGEDDDVARRNAAAVAEAQAVAAQALARLEAFKRRERSMECKTALAVLEEKCAAFSDY